MGRTLRLVLTAVAAVGGLFAGSVGGGIAPLLRDSRDYPFLAEEVPLPHHVPKYQGGVAFRFAMAHDVIHERFAKHGLVHYRERDRLTRDKLKGLSADDPAAFSLADDLGVGLDRLGRSDEAVTVLRDKLARQQAKGLAGRALYTSYANLGTFLIHASFAKAVAGDVAARERFREGVRLVRKSVEVNPEAHFGREQWQSAIAEFFLAAMESPELLRTFDCLGNRLDHSNRRNRPYRSSFHITLRSGRAAEGLSAFFQPGAEPDDPSRWLEFSPIREHIAKVGAEEGWDKEIVPSHTWPAPFDEPVLGIIGMWRQGGGANPHFALALGETMLRVGQRYIAWTAFERASRLAERYWPVPALQQSLRDHCQKRQAEIEDDLLQDKTTPARQAEVAGLRSKFETELAYGEGYQRAYQQYEQEKIAAGVPISDPHFFDDFHAGREPIASPVDPEEWYVFVPGERVVQHDIHRALAWAMFGAGLAAMVTALLCRWRANRVREGEQQFTASF